MKKILLLLAIVLICTTFVSAQDTKPMTMFAGGGLTMPMGDLGDYTKMGYHGMGAIGLNLMPVIQAIGKVEYHTMNLDWGDLEDGGGAFKVTMFGVAGRVAPPMPASKIKIFGLAGAGFAAYKYDSDETFDINDLGSISISNTSDTENDMYFEIGGGLEFAAGTNLNLFAMARFVSVATEGKASTFVPITVGLKF
ncbi:MAG: hypothetical protein R3F48_11140 [Candidatus Zixiibacteriota bacterium]